MLKSLCEISAFSFNIVNSVVHWKLILPIIFVVSTIDALISFPVTSLYKRLLFVSQMECIKDFCSTGLYTVNLVILIHSFLKNIICTSFFSNIKLYYTQYLFFSGLETAANIEITGKILKGIDFLDLNITEPSNWMPPQSH